MKCQNCSRTNPEHARFCQNCGQPLERGCANCGTLNPAAASFCSHCGASLSEQSNRLGALRQAAPQNLQEKIQTASATLEGQRKPVTILFTDIVGSTSLAENLDPEEWREIVTGAHQLVSEAIYRYEGTIAQLLGDGVLAFFGAPITHEDDPIRAVRAGLDIQASIEEYARGLKGYVDNFQLRVGINTGTVVVGSVGSDMHMEYLAIGDAVNLAARLQSEAQPGHLLISGATARQVRAVFDLNDIGDIRVKGKSAPVRVFGVVDRKAVPSSGRGIEGLAAPLVGREEELAVLRTALQQLVEGHGQVVAVLGEAGIGKSRLVEEARADGALASLRWLEGRSLSYGQTLSFWAITQLINSHLGVTDGDPEAKVKAALRKRVTALFGDRPPDVLPYLAHLMGVRLEEDSARRVDQLDGETLKRQVLWAASEYFQRAAAERPTVLVLEDLHWADPSTLEALDHLLDLTDRCALCVLMLARIERDHGSWSLKVRAETDFAHRYTEIQLAPLSADHSNELVSRLLVVADLPEGVRRLILERSEGNPFYLEEIIRSLIEQGALVRDGSSWRATNEITTVEIPETLQGVLLARIDRLQEDVRRTLQLASVIGKSFLYRLLEAIAAAERTLDQHLSQLQRADLVREKTRRPELEYIFKHSLTQEAAYNSLLIERRKDFHRKVGEALEQLFADRQEEFFGLLAHHFDAAGEHPKAIDYLIKAGDTARHQDASEEAAQHYRRAIELLEQEGDTDRLIRTWLKLGLIHQVNFQFEQAHQANEMAFSLERQARGDQKPQPPDGEAPREPRTLTVVYAGAVGSLDPSQMTYTHESWIGSHLFAGLVELDAEANIVPNVARSWEVLDGGTRYVFHLRDDVRWTDGSPVTADDFAWTWERYLAPGSAFPMAGIGDDVAGVRALDAFTFEVRLKNPVAYFIYLAAQPPTWALPKAAVEKYGDDWWRPGNVISSGPFELAEFDENHGRLQRNPNYFGRFLGNLDALTWERVESAKASVRAFMSGQANYVPNLRRTEVAEEIPANQIIQDRPLFCLGLTLIPDQPPMDNVLFRRAIAHAIDRERLARTLDLGTGWAHGGIVPPGLMGHSPELGLALDVNRARQLLAEAGFPRVEDLPPLKIDIPDDIPEFRYGLSALQGQLGEHLGLHLALIERPPGEVWWKKGGANLNVGGWVMDYPDPDNILRQSHFYRILRNRGWRHPRLEQLLEEAARTVDRARRLAMYREADRILVNEEALVVPIAYTSPRSYRLVKPSIKGARFDSMGNFDLRSVSVAPD